MRFRVFYLDGSTFEDAPEDAPAVGIICIAQETRAHGWVLRHSKDFYCWDWDESEWWGSDTSGFWQHMFRTGLKIVLFGTNTNDENFNRIMAVGVTYVEARNKEEGR